jgi:hypothetical protein
MPIQTDLNATLSQGVETPLHRARAFQKARVTVTGIAGEFATIPMKTKTNGFVDSGFFEATQVELTVFQTLGGARILATTPQGVGSLDIVYDVRTGKDA